MHFDKNCLKSTWYIFQASDSTDSSDSSDQKALFFAQNFISSQKTFFPKKNFFFYKQKLFFLENFKNLKFNRGLTNENTQVDVIFPIRYFISPIGNI